MMMRDLSCPNCKEDFCVIQINIVTEWGIENFCECTNCGIIFREIKNDK